MIHLSKRKVALITGTRRNGEDVRKAVWDALEQFLPDVVVHGDHWSGADSYAAKWCWATRTHQERFPAQWRAPAYRQNPAAAGPIRNTRMVDWCQAQQCEGDHVEGFAFPDPKSRGTRDCIRKLRVSGLKYSVTELDGGADA